MNASTIKGHKNEATNKKTPEHNFFVRLLSHNVLFALHLFAYVAVMGLLILIWGLNTGTNGLAFWPMHAMFGWGFGMGFHALVYLMYTDKVEYLAKIRRQSTFGVLFVIHAWFYASVSIYLLILNLSLIPEVLFFTWPLSMWGIGFGIHALGFLTYKNIYQREMGTISKKNPDYAANKLKSLVNMKIFNFWLLVAHVGYFVAGTILEYTLASMGNISGASQLDLIEGTLMWATILGIHAFGYILYYYNSTIKPAVKGLILNIAFYTGVNAWLIYEFLTEIPSAVFYPMYPLIIWGVAIGVHAFLTMNWDVFKARAEATMKNQYANLDKYRIEKKVWRLLFWQWIFISHVAIYITGIIMIAINLGITGNIGLIIHPIMGWGIAVAIHGSFFLISYKQIKGFFPITATIHLTTYIIVGIYLVILNVMFGGFPWAAIALAGWGIGLGLHLIIGYYSQKR